MKADRKGECNRCPFYAWSFTRARQHNGAEVEYRQNFCSHPALVESLGNAQYLGTQLASEDVAPDIGCLLLEAETEMDLVELVGANVGFLGGGGNAEVEQWGSEAAEGGGVERGAGGAWSAGIVKHGA